MRIALVSNTTWNISNFRQNIIQKLMDEGHDVFVIAPVDEFISYKKKYPTLKHISLKFLQRSGKNPIVDFILIEEFRRKYKKLKLDFVVHYTHKPNLYGTFGAAINRVPSVNVITGLGYSFINKNFAHYVTVFLYKIAARFTKKLVFQNPDDRQYFKELGIYKKDVKSMVIKSSGLNLDHYYLSKPNFDKEKLIFTFIGRLLFDKGIYEFVTAAINIRKKHKHVEFRIIGELDLDNPASITSGVLSDWVNSGDLHYLGFKQDVRSFIKESHCIVLPSYREGMPRVVMEAQAMGRAVITTDAPGCRHSIDPDISGLLVKVKDSKSLEEGILKFMKLPQEEITTMGQKGRLKAEKEFDDKIVAQKLYDLILSNTKQK